LSGLLDQDSVSGSVSFSSYPVDMGTAVPSCGITWAVTSRVDGLFISDLRGSLNYFQPLASVGTCVITCTNITP
jgi:hypothetical protein